MTGDEWKRFAFDTPRTAKLATVRADGSPHVAPIWVALDGDEGELLTWATKIGRRYMGAERAEEFGRRNSVPTELLVRVRPRRIVGQWNVSE